MHAIKKLYVSLALLAIAVSCHMEMPPMPVADFSSSVSSCTAPCTIDFTSTSQNAESLEWEFDDDKAKATGETVSHRFATGRRYYVKLLVKNSTGASHGVTKIIDVLPEPEAKPVAKFTWEPQGDIYVGDKVTFINQSDNSARHEWNFDDENATQSNPNTSAEDRPVHTFSKARTYNVKLKAFNGSGDESTAPAAIKVLNHGVVASFEVQGADNCTAPCEVSITNTSQYADTYVWTYGNGVNYTGQNPSKQTYDAPGTYKITLVASGPGGSDTKVFEFQVKAADVNAVAITGTGEFWGNDIVTDAGGNIYVCGLVRGITDFGNNIVLSGNGSSEDAFVAKYDKNLRCQWARIAGGSGWDEAHKIAVDNAGDVYMAGKTEGGTFASFAPQHFGKQDGFVAKLNGANGNVLWAKTVGGAGDDAVFGIAYSPSNDRIYIAGKVTGSGLNFNGTIHNAIGEDLFFVFVNPANGEVRQPTIIGGPGNQQASSVVADNEGNAYFTGFYTQGFVFPENHGVPTLTNMGDIDGFVAKWIAYPGKWLWASQAASSGHDSGDDLVLDDQKNVYVTGTHKGTMPRLGIGSAGDENIFVAKWNMNGALDWARNGVSDGGADHAGGIAITGSGNLIVHGSFSGTGQFPFNQGSVLRTAGAFDVFLSEINPRSNGDNTGLSSKSAGGSGIDRAMGVCTTSDDHIYSIGSFSDSGTFNGTRLTSKSGGLNIYIVKWK